MPSLLQPNLSLWPGTKTASSCCRSRPAEIKRAEISPLNVDSLFGISNSERQKLEYSSNNTLLNDIKIATCPEKSNGQVILKGHNDKSLTLSFLVFRLRKCENFTDLPSYVKKTSKC